MTAATPHDYSAVSPRKSSRSTAVLWGSTLSIVIALIWVAGFSIGFQRSITMISMVGLIATLIGMAKPTLGVFGIGILCTADPMMRVFVLTGGLFRWNTFNYVLLMAMGLSLPLLLRRRELPVRMLEVFLLFLVINLMFMPSISGGVQHILGAVAFFGLLIYFMRGAKDELVWEWLAIVCGIVGSLGGLLFFLQKDSLPYINQNALSFLPLTGIFACCLARTYQSDRKEIATAIWILVVANVVWVILSGSRGGMTIAASCLLYLLTGIPGVSSRIIILAGGVMLGGVIASHFAEQSEYVAARFDKSVSSDVSMSSRTSGRSDLAIGGWRMFLEHPFIGVGTGGYALAWKNLDNREGLSNYAADRASQAHSAWVKTLAESGVPGTLMLVAFVLSFVIMGYSGGERPLFYLGLLVTVTMVVAFISTEFQGKGLWFFSAGATVVLTQEMKRLRAERIERRRQRLLAAL